MRKLVLLFLCVAAVLDVSQQAYSIDLIGTIAHRPAGSDILAIVANSAIVATVKGWGLFLIGFGALSLAMSLKRPNKPEIIG